MVIVSCCYDCNQWRVPWFNSGCFLDFAFFLLFISCTWECWAQNINLSISPMLVLWGNNITAPISRLQTSRHNNILGCQNIDGPNATVLGSKYSYTCRPSSSSPGKIILLHPSADSKPAGTIIFCAVKTLLGWLLLCWAQNIIIPISQSLALFRQ